MISLSPQQPQPLFFFLLLLLFSSHNLHQPKFDTLLSSEGHSICYAKFGTYPVYLAPRILTALKPSFVGGLQQALKLQTLPMDPPGYMLINGVVGCEGPKGRP